ncbi:hypothetical protein MHLP_01870 [Candidatus Mycoplasma haematolamae str. Purdue]|uniref:Uncharacterized protein n=1 Tax=Mycoplasma haematolamae (strain Purdue) TaxID=1212765 RepID=I7CJE2_MYCHA|nr:hypothetical protein [Candidatus Mycoplasma haematolamae]AFO51954.1 hypothetical protein MHLP_01870 [Candidatus Mycoplasma haematolamae str. Purdue]
MNSFIKVASAAFVVGGGSFVATTPVALLTDALEPKKEHTFTFVGSSGGGGHQSLTCLFWAERTPYLSIDTGQKSITCGSRKGQEIVNPSLKSAAAKTNLSGLNCENTNFPTKCHAKYFYKKSDSEVLYFV